ncbi:PEP/pyruvate-binding domain-containing protein [Candidatus Neomarinimicrobiota bacterium]
MKNNKSIDKIVIDLKERAKELSCLYEIQEIFRNLDASVEETCMGMVKAIPPGWQFPEICVVRINYHELEFKSENFKETKWTQSCDIILQDEIVGSINVFYTEERTQLDQGPFLKEERKLINTIAGQFGLFLLHKRLRNVFAEQKEPLDDRKSEWGVILDLLKRTDPKLLIRISRKMLNFLCWSGIKKAEQLLQNVNPVYSNDGELLKEANQPYQKSPTADILELSYEIFNIAADNLSQKEVLNRMQKWIQEDRSGFLINTLEDSGSSLSDISNSIERFHHLVPQGLELSSPREISFMVALIRRILSDQPGFISIAKKFIEVDDFNKLLSAIIFPVGSHGKLGGKSSGLFLAEQIVKKSSKDNDLLKSIKIPKTWYITSDSILNFMRYNNLEDVIEQKYKDIGQIRQEYPYVVHVFKNSPFPPEIIRGLSLAIDDFGEVPLIVRSSSLLEDRLGAAFAGKYKSLFIANQGSKEDRLMNLMDAIAEVYASTFGPDPIEYRKEQGLLDYHEEMGILIQAVVGQKVGNYFFPAFAGVALSNNEFRWSNRIKLEDGLVRIVPGLGTRAVDRVSDDYPILMAPGEPNLRVNVTLDEMIRYSPKYIDVINLETSSFETLEIDNLIKNHGKDYPFINNIISILKENHTQLPRALGTDYANDNFVVTFEGLITRTPFVKQIHELIINLRNNFEHPIDIEFAHDGKDFYLLQCRTQSMGLASKPAVIPDDIPVEKVIFSANKYVSNGIVSNISHIVYVSPQKYSEITDYQHLISVGRAIGKLNKILPKRQFILMGPGRWGSRGDIKLGVNVTYSDINNTSVLIEIAKKQKDYVPDLSFGTHFFQDLVEANIRYLPLYPDDKGNIFYDEFLDNSENVFLKMLPDFTHIGDVVKVLDVPAITKGLVLQILMNAEKNKAVGMLTEDSHDFKIETDEKNTLLSFEKSEVHWRWRQRNIEGLARQIDIERFGVKGFYLLGSTKNATAGPASDIDILIHFDGTKEQRKDLDTWLDGWSHSLSQMNFLRTGYETDGLLDVHIITDEDIKNKTSYALKIGAVTDAARPLEFGTNVKNKK